MLHGLPLHAQELRRILLRQGFWRRDLGRRHAHPVQRVSEPVQRPGEAAVGGLAPHRLCAFLGAFRRSDGSGRRLVGRRRRQPLRAGEQLHSPGSPEQFTQSAHPVADHLDALIHGKTLRQQGIAELATGPRPVLGGLLAERFADLAQGVDVPAVQRLVGLPLAASAPREGVDQNVQFAVAQQQEILLYFRVTALLKVAIQPLRQSLLQVSGEVGILEVYADVARREVTEFQVVVVQCFPEPASP